MGVIAVPSSYLPFALTACTSYIPLTSLWCHNSRCPLPLEWWTDVVDLNCRKKLCVYSRHIHSTFSFYDRFYYYHYVMYVISLQFALFGTRVNVWALIKTSL